MTDYNDLVGARRIREARLPGHFRLTMLALRLALFAPLRTTRTSTIKIRTNVTAANISLASMRDVGHDIPRLANQQQEERP